MPCAHAFFIVTCAGMLARPARAAQVAPRSEPKPIELSEALRLLESQSLTFAEARARVEQANGVLRMALAGAMPTLGVAGSYIRNSDAASAPLALIDKLDPAAPPLQNLVIQPLDVWTGSASLRVPLVVPSAWADYAAARSGKEAAEATAAATRLSLRAALVQAAWLISGSEGVVTASEKAVANADAQADAAQRAVDAGTGVPLAVLQARTEAVKRRSDLATAISNLGRANLAAGVLLGRAEPMRIPLEAAKPPPPADPGALQTLALSQRPEMRALQAQLEQAQRQVTSAELLLSPQISASGSGFAQTQPLPTGKDQGWRVSVDLVWSLYDGGYRYGKRQQAEGTVSAARAALEAQRVQIIQEVADAARDLSVAAERLALAEDQTGLASEAAATASRGFVAGTSGSLDVLDANDRLYQADVGLANARAQLGIAVAALDRAVGRD
jgi:outer membrane protein TolC